MNLTIPNDLLILCVCFMLLCAVSSGRAASSADESHGDADTAGLYISSWEEREGDLQDAAAHVLGHSLQLEKSESIRSLNNQLRGNWLEVTRFLRDEKDWGGSDFLSLATAVRWHLNAEMEEAISCAISSAVATTKDDCEHFGNTTELDLYLSHCSVPASLAMLATIEACLAPSESYYRPSGRRELEDNLVFWQEALLLLPKIESVAEVNKLEYPQANGRVGEHSAEVPSHLFRHGWGSVRIAWQNAAQVGPEFATVLKQLPNTSRTRERITDVFNSLKLRSMGVFSGQPVVLMLRGAPAYLLLPCRERASRENLSEQKAEAQELTPPIPAIKAALLVRVRPHSVEEGPNGMVADCTLLPTPCFRVFFEGDNTWETIFPAAESEPSEKPAR